MEEQQQRRQQGWALAAVGLCVADREARRKAGVGLEQIASWGERGRGVVVLGPSGSAEHWAGSFITVRGDRVEGEGSYWTTPAPWLTDSWQQLSQPLSRPCAIKGQCAASLRPVTCWQGREGRAAASSEASLDACALISAVLCRAMCKSRLNGLPEAQRVQSDNVTWMRERENASVGCRP